MDATGVQGIDYEAWIKAHTEKTTDGKELTLGCKLDFAGMIRVCFAGRDQEDLAVALLSELHGTDLEVAMEQTGAELARNKYVMDKYWDGTESIEAGLRRYGRLSYRAARRRLLTGELADVKRRLARVRIAWPSDSASITNSRQRSHGENVPG